MCTDPAVDSKGPAGAPKDEIEVTPEMALAGSRVLAGIFEYAMVGDWETMDHASAVYRAMSEVHS
jgi:hypothetical protein